MADLHIGQAVLSGWVLARCCRQAWQKICWHGVTTWGLYMSSKHMEHIHHSLCMDLHMSLTLLWWCVWVIGNRNGTWLNLPRWIVEWNTVVYIIQFMAIIDSENIKKQSTDIYKYLLSCHLNLPSTMKINNFQDKNHAFHQWHHVFFFIAKSPFFANLYHKVNKQSTACGWSVWNSCSLIIKII